MQGLFDEVNDFILGVTPIYTEKVEVFRVLLLHDTCKIYVSLAVRIPFMRLCNAPSILFVCSNGWLCDDRVQYVSMKLSLSTRQEAHILGCLCSGC